MTMMSLRMSSRGPQNRTIRWTIAGVCAAALATGFLLADADLASLQKERDAVAAEVSQKSATLAELRTHHGVLAEELKAARETIATHESMLASRDGLLP